MGMQLCKTTFTHIPEI